MVTQLFTYSMCVTLTESQLNILHSGNTGSRIHCQLTSHEEIYQWIYCDKSRRASLLLMTINNWVSRQNYLKSISGTAWKNRLLSSSQSTYTLSYWIEVTWNINVKVNQVWIINRHGVTLIDPPSAVSLQGSGSWRHSGVAAAEEWINFPTTLPLHLQRGKHVTKVHRALWRLSLCSVWALTKWSWSRRKAAHPFSHGYEEYFVKDVLRVHTVNIYWRNWWNMLITV